MGARVVSYLNVGENKGNARIWMESQRLAKNGFTPGEAYLTRLDPSTNALVVELDLFGDRRVSSRKRPLKDGSTVVPIIDLCSSEITDYVSDFRRVRVEYLPGKIVISLHHEDMARIARNERIKRNLKAGQIDTGTICAGTGISTAAIHDGLKEAGIKSRCQWVIDMDSKYLEIADRNNHAISDRTDFFIGKVEEVEAGLLKPVDLLNASLPCNVHSKSGKAKKGLDRAEDDESITAVMGFLNIVRVLNPALITSENVTEAMSSAAYAMIRYELRRLGYVVSEKILNETHAGSLETRKRYWFVAVSEGLQAVDLDDFVKREKAYKTISDVLEDNHGRESKNIEILRTREEKNKEEGRNFKINLITGEEETIGTMGKGYAKGRLSEPHLITGPDQVRLLTVTEASRCRDIPDHLLGDCGFTVGHEAGGQSILYNHGTGIGKLIAARLVA